MVWGEGDAGERRRSASGVRRVGSGESGRSPLVVIATLAIAVLLSACGGGTAPPTSSPPTPPPPEPLPAATAKPLPPPVPAVNESVVRRSACTQLTRTVDEQVSIAEDRLPALEPYLNADPYDARDFVNVVNPRDYTAPEDQITETVDAVVGDVAQALFGSSKASTSLRDELRIRLIDECFGSADAFDATVQPVRTLAFNWGAVDQLAEQAPWYPRGFSATQVATVAYRWRDDSAGCEGAYYSGCGSADFVTQRGCTSMFVDVDFIDAASGRVTDWSIDAAYSVAPGEIFTLAWETYTDGVGSIRITDVSCF